MSETADSVILLFWWVVGLFVIFFVGLALSLVLWSVKSEDERAGNFTMGTTIAVVLIWILFGFKYAHLWPSQFFRQFHNYFPM